jgi:hypothetical protein
MEVDGVDEWTPETVPEGKLLVTPSKPKISLRLFFLDLAAGRVLSVNTDGSRRMVVTDFAGSLYSANLDGSDRKTLLFGQGNLTGLAYAELPAGHAASSEPHA